MSKSNWVGTVDRKGEGCVQASESSIQVSKGVRSIQSGGKMFTLTLSLLLVNFLGKVSSKQQYSSKDSIDSRVRTQISKVG